VEAVDFRFEAAKGADGEARNESEDHIEGLFEHGMKGLRKQSSLEEGLVLWSGSLKSEVRP
jgi:hypothetical protein